MIGKYIMNRKPHTRVELLRMCREKRYYMEVTLLGLAFSVLFTLGKRAFPEGNILKFAADSAAESAAGEILEEAIEAVTKKVSNRNKKKKIIAAMLQKLKEINFSNEDIEEFAKLASSTYIKNESLKYKSDEYVKALKSITTQKDQKKRIKEFEKILDAVVTSVQNGISKNLRFMDSKELAEDYFKREDLPDSVIEVVKAVSDCIYEIKYVTLADDERDIVKLVQQVIKENNASLLEGLSGYFSLILQQNAQLNAMRKDASIQSGEWKPAEEIKKLEKSNPLVWVELKCPKCAAGGDCIERYSDYIICKKCGGKYSIYNDPLGTAEDVLGEMNANLRVEIKSALDKVNEELHSSLTELGGDVTESIDALDAKIAKMSSQILLSDSKIIEALNFAAKDSEIRDAAIKDAVKRASSEILAEMKNNQRSLDDAISARLDAHDALMIEKMDEIKELVKEGLRLFTHGNNLIPMAGVSSSKRYCSICGRDSLKWDNDRHCSCGLTEGEKDRVLRLEIYDGGSYIWIFGDKVFKAPMASVSVNFASLRKRNKTVTSNVEIGILKGLSKLVIDSEDSVSSGDIEWVLSRDYFSGCSTVILTNRVKIDGEIEVEGWTYNAQEGVLEKKA